jgi:CRP/FNR family transcriptional regulator, cyclic AMP receptor protein
MRSAISSPRQRYEPRRPDPRSLHRCRQFKQAEYIIRSTIAVGLLVLRQGLGWWCWMRAVLDYCTGGIQRALPAGALVLHEGSKTGHLFVLLEGRLEVIKGDSVVAILTEPGAMLGEMSVLLDQPHTATVRAAADSVVYEFDDAAAFLREQPAVALLIARLLAQRLNVANTYLADLMHQYAGQGNHLSMVGELLQSMINLPPSQVSPGSDRQSDPRV